MFTPWLAAGFLSFNKEVQIKEIIMIVVLLQTLLIGVEERVVEIVNAEEQNQLVIRQIKVCCPPYSDLVYMSHIYIY